MSLARRLFQVSLLVVVFLAFPLSSAGSSTPTDWSPLDSPTGSTLVSGPFGPTSGFAKTDATQQPVAIQIPAVEVDAGVEQNRIVDGAMLDPSGPWIVSWYRETAPLGGQGNTVMAGHLDYWDVGPAVFYNLESLDEGDEIHVTGKSGDVFTYEVTWTRLYQLKELNSEGISEIVGSTSAPSLTLITCGGEFDQATGQYLSRYIVRAELKSVT